MGLPGDLSATAAVAGSSWHRQVRMPPPEHRFDLVNVPPFKPSPRLKASQLALRGGDMCCRSVRAFLFAHSRGRSIYPDRLPATYEAIDLTRT